jgi:uncharacterized membrane protein
MLTLNFHIETQKMHSKERTAWVWFICLLIVPTLYFVWLRNLNVLSASPDLSRLVNLALPLVVMALVALGVKLMNVRTASAEGKVSLDERDQLIEARASAVAYQVLMAGMIVVGMVMPFSATRWELIDTAFFAIVLAELVHAALILKAYRNGIHV